MKQDKFLLVKGISGLGDRIKCVLTAILYARLTGRRLVVDWSDPSYSNAGTNAFHRYFQCTLCNPTDEIPATDSVSPSIWRGHLNESCSYMRECYGTRGLSIDLTRLDYQETVLVFWKYGNEIELLRSYFQGEFEEFAQLRKKEILRKLLREDLTLHPQLQGRVDQLKDNFFGKKTVGVHVRYTDHRTHVWTVLKRLNALLERAPDLQIFLSTDNIQIKNMFEDGYPGVITTPHWYPSTPGLRIHSNPNHPDPMESGNEALVDLYLLAECNYLIIDTSSNFSAIAALLTRAPHSNIFDVKRRKKRSARVRHVAYRLMLGTGLLSWGLGILRRFVRKRVL